MLLSPRKKIKVFNPESFNDNFSKGELEKFFLREYNLIPIEPKQPILSIKEANILLSELKLINPDIEEIIIKYQVNGVKPLIFGTLPIYGILSITNDIKVFSYYNGEFFDFLLEEERICQYFEKDIIFNYNDDDNYILNRYFVKFVIKEDEIKEENGENKLEEKKKEIDYQTNIIFLQKKRNFDCEK